METSRPLPLDGASAVDDRAAATPCADPTSAACTARLLALVAAGLVLVGPLLIATMFAIAAQYGLPSPLTALNRPGAWRFASRLGSLWDYAVDLPLIGCVFAIISCVVRANCLAFLALGAGLAFVALACLTTLRLFG